MSDAESDRSATRGAGREALALGQPAAPGWTRGPHRRRPHRGRRPGHHAGEQGNNLRHVAELELVEAGHSAVPLTYPTAAKLGRTSAYDWGSQCDHTTGRLKIPTVYAPPCVPVFTGANGGATSSGVSEGTINIVYYQPQPGGLAATISAAAGTNAQTLATAQAYVAMFNQIYEMYGRHMNLIPFTASGADNDPVAAHADAVTVAQQLHALRRSMVPVRPPPTRTSWPGCTYCAWPAATRPPTAR